ncbi:MAG: ABC transporter ATP-binding protein, partial [Eubacterium sp.]|nr:ABC transporter ATP-binding protein [Eubacterium sp.]
AAITAQYFAAKAATGFGKQLRYALFDKIESLSFSEIDRVGTSSLITRLTTDSNQVQNGVNLVLRLFLRSPFIVFGAMIMAFTVDVKSAFIFVGVIPVLSIVVFGIMAYTIPKYKQVQNSLDSITLKTRENLSGARVIRAFTQEENEINDFIEKNDILTRLQKSVGRISALMNPVTYVIINIGVIVLIYSGAVQVDTGKLSQGEVVALYNYMSQILVELIKLANLIITVTKALACASRIESVLNLENSLEHNNDNEIKSSNAVDFNNVSLKYKDASDNSLENISFSAEKGSVIGVIGGSGSGKTSLVSLIPHFYDATSGNVLVDGVDVKSYSDDDLRQKIGFVLQKAALFKGTVRENLKWGSEEATDE